MADENGKRLWKQIPAEVEEGKFQQYFLSKSGLFRALCEAKEIVGNDPENDKQFAGNKEVNIASEVDGERDNERHMQQFRRVLLEIDEICSYFISRGHIRTFLDICSAPGGFSRCILDKSDAVGMGVTLPIEEGGHVLHGSLVGTSRYHCLFTDVVASPMDIHFSPPPPQTPRLSRDANDNGAAQPAAQKCDYAIMGGMYHGNKPWLLLQGMRAAQEKAKAQGLPTPEVPELQFADHESGAHALHIAQLIVALNNLAPGGTLMLTLSCHGMAMHCSTVCLLHKLFSGGLRSAKVRCMHAHRATFRLVCFGYSVEAAKEYRVLEGLGEALDVLKSGKHVDALSVPTCVGGIPEMIERWGDYCMELFQPVWAIQLEALQSRFANSFRGGKSAWGDNAASARGRQGAQVGGGQGLERESWRPVSRGREDAWGGRRDDAPQSVTNEKSKPVKAGVYVPPHRMSNASRIADRGAGSHGQSQRW